MKKFLVHLLCGFIPFRELRRKTRSYLLSEKSECPSCGAKMRHRFIGNHPDFNLREVQCKKCGFCFTNTCDINDLSVYYKSEYRVIRRESPTEAYIDTMNKRAVAQIDFIRQSTPELDLQTADILEIGCGCGALLRQCGTGRGRKIGVEGDNIMADFASTYATDADITNDIFRDKMFEESSFDVIMMSHVLEHIPNVRDFMQSLRHILKPDGYLFVEVPTEKKDYVVKIIGIRKKGNAHLLHFTSEHLSKTLAKFGFKVVRCSTFTANYDEWVAGKKPPLDFARSFPDGIHIRCIARVVK
jgi:2-polyprenyl-3-methyl-5-hydroxy-6-metoxy-1,4-benzoquinol methylase